MNAVAHLAGLLARSQAEADPGGLDQAPSTAQLDASIARLAQRVGRGSAVREPLDLQRDAVQRFLDSRRLATLRDARLVAFGLGLPCGPDGRSLLEDKGRLAAVLQAADAWLDRPRWFRRCFQGLVWSYFNAAGDAGPGANPNWPQLRDYLQRRVGAIREGAADPDWVKTLDANRALFSASPCQDFVAPLLRGERAGLQALCAQLGIDAASWFLRDLVEAQVVAATQLGHDEFLARLPAMLAMLAGGHACRDSGLARLLERHAQLPLAPLHEGLRDALAQAWGCPWRPLDALCWEGVGEAPRKLAGDWLKGWLIDRFFVRLGDAGGRRASLWKRYVQSIQRVELAWPGAAPGSGPERGLVTRLHDATGDAAALVLTIGCARLVAFAEPGESVWAYDLRRQAPFDTGRPLAWSLDAPNALRQSGRDLCLPHQDGLNGWRQWEQAFEAALTDRFGIRVGAPATIDPAAFVDLSDTSVAPATEGPGVDEPAPARPWHSAPNGEDVHWQTAEAMSVPYSRPDLEVLARVHALRLKEGGLGRGRVRVDPRNVDARIARVLARWGFRVGDDGDWVR